MSRTVLAIAILFATSPPAFADECQDAAKDVMREAEAAGLEPQYAAQVKLLVEQALGRRETGDKMGCLSGIEEAREIVSQQD